jgi:hypothetical protein
MTHLRLLFYYTLTWPLHHIFHTLWLIPVLAANPRTPSPRNPNQVYILTPEYLPVCQAILSSLKLFLTNRTVQSPNKPAHRYGTPHPTPKAMLSSNATIKIVVTMAIIIKLMPQNHVSRNSMRLNGGLASYLFITASRCAISPRASIAPVSSSIASNAGLQRAPFGVEDMSKGR